ncbi:MAG: ATP-binding cassette domain-containing protein [Patulibacter minatonensis]
MTAPTTDGHRHPARPAPHAGTANHHLVATDLCKGYGGRIVLDGVSVTISAGERLAVIGDNGVGKSTLLRLLAGTAAPDSGTVRCTTGRALVEQELDEAGDATVQTLIDAALRASTGALRVLDDASARLADGDAEATEAYEAALRHAEELGAWDAPRRLDADLDRFSAALPRDTPLARLSPGRRYRLRLACALHDPAGAILLDEPSNHLDDEALDELAGRLNAHAGLVVLVTHDRWLLSAVATSLLDLDPAEGGAGRRYGGTYAAFRAEHAATLARWRRRYEESVAEQERLEGELEAAQQRTPDAWKPGKGASKHGRASRIGSDVRSIRRRLEVGEREAVPRPPDPLEFSLPMATEASAPLLSASGLRLGTRVAQPEPIALRAGGRLRIHGPNGAGKSTLLALLAGGLTPDGGSVEHGPEARIGWLPQEDRLELRATALGELVRAARHSAALREHLRAPILAHDGSEEDGATAFPVEPDEVADAVLGTGLLRSADLRRRIGELSVGQRRRVDLARVILQRPTVLLLDEPTNHLSVTLVDDLSDALVDTPAAVVMVTHDRTLRDRAAGWPQLRLAGPPN